MISPVVRLRPSWPNCGAKWGAGGWRVPRPRLQPPSSSPAQCSASPAPPSISSLPDSPLNHFHLASYSLHFILPRLIYIHFTAKKSSTFTSVVCIFIFQPNGTSTSKVLRSCSVERHSTPMYMVSIPAMYVPLHTNNIQL